MNTFVKKIKLFFKKIWFLYPTPLPVGLSEFDAWANSIIDTYGAPNNDSVKFALATMVLHMDRTTARKSKFHFGQALRKAMANQVVSQVIQDLKLKQEAEIKAAKEAEAAKANEAQG